MAAVEYSEAETKKMIADAVQKGDVFRIRVMRRKANGMPEVIASFDDGRAEHLLYPEKWLPDLAGGGTYAIQGFHQSSPFESVGGTLLFNVENISPRLVNPETVQQGEWQGPLSLSYPRAGMRRPPSQYAGATSIDGATWNAGVDIDPRAGVTPLRSAGQNGGSDLDALARAQRAEQALLEMRKQTEIDNLRRDHAAQMERMNQSVNQLRDELRSARDRDSRPHGEGLADVLAKAVASLVPVVQTVITGQNELRVKMLDAQNQTTAQQMAVTREGNERLDKILTTMMQPKPVGIDPTVQLVLEHMKTSSTNPVLTDVINAFSGMSQATLSVMTAATDAGLLGNREESGASGVIRELGAAAGSFFNMMAERQGGGVPRGPYPAPGGPRRLPPAPQPQQPLAMGQLDQMIKAHFDPAQTARFFLDSLGRDADLTERFAQQNNDIEAFFRSYWSGWAQANLPVHGPYVSALHEAVMADAKARGWYVPPDPGHPSPQGPVQAQPPAQQPPPPMPYNQRQSRPVAPSPQGVILDDGLGEEEEDEEEPVDPGDN